MKTGPKESVTRPDGACPGPVRGGETHQKPPGLGHSAQRHTALDAL